MCSRHASVINRRNPTHRTLDVVDLARHGQQLTMADLILKKRRLPASPEQHPPIRWPAEFPIDHEQLVLFHHERRLDRAALAALRPPPIARLEHALALCVTSHGHAHGWRKDIRDRTMRAIRILLAIQDTPGAAISTRDARQIAHVRGASLKPALEVLDAAGMLTHDEAHTVDRWFERQITDLPDPLSTELREWFRVLRDGSSSTPRRRPRDPDTARSYVHAITPAIQQWAAAGHRSLREITRDDILTTITRHPSKLTHTALKSLFGLLKARRITFIDPTRRTRYDAPTRQELTPLESLEPITNALHSSDPAQAALTALVAFHALRTGQLTRIQLTDIIDGRLHIDGHTMLLADPVLDRMNRWHRHRSHRWPDTANPHLFVHSRTAPRTNAVTGDWIRNTIGLAPSRIRTDRILHEVVASRNDPRRLSDLFGISIQTAERYIADVGQTTEHALVHTPST